VIKAVRERELAVSHDLDLAYFVGDWTAVCREERLPGSTLVVEPGIS
jgi:hypothetical protein